MKSLSFLFDISKVLLGCCDVLWNRRKGIKDWWLLSFVLGARNTSCGEKQEEESINQAPSCRKMSLGNWGASERRKCVAGDSSGFVGNRRRAVWSRRVLPHELLWLVVKRSWQKHRSTVSSAAAFALHLGAQDNPQGSQLLFGSINYSGILGSFHPAAEDSSDGTRWTNGGVGLSAHPASVINRQSWCVGTPRTYTY